MISGGKGGVANNDLLLHIFGGVWQPFLVISAGYRRFYYNYRVIVLLRYN